MPNIGLGYDEPLLDWLENYTYPLENKYTDLKFSEKVYDAVVKRTLNVGTTTACYFGSLYDDSTFILAEKASKYHQRAFVGKINANVFRDDGYFEETNVSIENTKKFIDNVLSLNDPLVQPIITPRFALSCDMDLLKQLGKLAQEKNLHIQTHVSENLSEIEICKEMFKDCPTYCNVYEKAGLLTNKTVLAHGIYLQDSELDLLKKYKTAVIHCPSSNTYLMSGLCNIQRLISRGVKVGLGTDVAGGSNPSMLDTIRSAITVSNHLAHIHENKPLNYVDLFHLATIGGAKSLGIDDKVGSLTTGKYFDALLIDMNNHHHNGPLDNLIDYTLEQQLQRLIYSGDDRNIYQVFVAGHKVK
ncbi:hypothetical protein HCN44_009027 [Aphidius gifuensis]|uniref:guanine deaminase n=2 Tax=Aphidius gifuensis TaxID=684658 RepID=A0A834XRR7_APHGI|nr:hypothetical protein HCN44_009027 [Aphidius gifuensis]